MNSALVCKAFSHAALDILWEEVEDFLHLLKTIGPNLAQDSPSHYILRGCILQARWERFYSYASRIRVLHVGEHETKYTISTSVYDRLTFQARHRRLFPSLVDLHWKARRAVGSCLLTFITPSLRRVRVTYELKTRTGERATPDHSFRDALYVLGSEAPLFSELELLGNVCYSRSLPAVADFTFLKDLRIVGDVSASAVIRCCGPLPTLVHLELCALAGAGKSDGPLLDGFYGLEEFSVRGRASVIAHLLHHIKSPSLFKVSVTFQDYNWDQWTECLQLLYPFKGLLRHLTCRGCLLVIVDKPPLVLNFGFIMKPLWTLDDFEPSTSVFSTLWYQLR
ncbi:hypothetical protein SCP_0502950 [Sparassis crispa]|uniref:F-box domain-containing protein n=1 Tax=Sparassis crispa TaxID=139825 RepID=A0A401GM18_9APHY|nr:hypothetical protein SCP_0502950 [Sparassis crispa]GBE83247.1 hypothetical protein SCP_0502950 [Sparassis crispa]